MKPLKCQYCLGKCYPYTYSNPEAIKQNICTRCYIEMTKIIETKNKCGKCYSFHQHSSIFYTQCGTCNICHPVWDILRCARSVKFNKLPDCIKMDDISRIKQYINAFYTRCDNCRSFHAKNETIHQCQDCKDCCTSLIVHKLTCFGPPGKYKYKYTCDDRDHHCNCSTCSTNNSLNSLSSTLTTVALFAMINQL